MKTQATYEGRIYAHVELSLSAAQITRLGDHQLNTTFEMLDERGFLCWQVFHGNSCNFAIRAAGMIDDGWMPAHLVYFAEDEWSDDNFDKAEAAFLDDLNLVLLWAFDLEGNKFLEAEVAAAVAAHKMPWYIKVADVRIQGEPAVWSYTEGAGFRVARGQ